jgi:hypothetical protein
MKLCLSGCGCVSEARSHLLCLKWVCQSLKHRERERALTIAVSLFQSFRCPLAKKFPETPNFRPGLLKRGAWVRRSNWSTGRGLLQMCSTRSVRATRGDSACLALVRVYRATRQSDFTYSGSRIYVLFVALTQVC